MTPLLAHSVRLTILATLLSLGVGTPARAADSFDETIRPLLREYCVTCHSTADRQGELDLERFSSLERVKQDPEVWQHVLDQVAIGEMPPGDAPQPSAEQKQRLMDWVRQTLRHVALARAGDPGPVVLRRLSNREYTYTLHDLTGVASLDPAREFPVDGAAGEGFTNAGAALVMSPALLRKYLDAAKEVSRHLVLLPDGVRFSASDSPRDWSAEALTAIRGFYRRHTVPTEVVNTVAGTGQVTAEGGAIPLDRYLDALQHGTKTDGLSPKYLGILRRALESQEPSLLLAPLRTKYAAGQLTAADIEPWQKELWRFSTVGQIGRANGPKAWMEPAAPLVTQQEWRIPLDGTGDQTLFLVCGSAGDGVDGDEVVWEGPRLVAKGRPDIPVGVLPELTRHLESQRAQLLADTEACLAALATDAETAPPESVAAWREYLGLGSPQLEPLLTTKSSRIGHYDFVRGWTGPNALSVLANSSDATVRVPGILQGHSVATHPAPDRAAVIAWRSPAAAKLRITGSVRDAHTDCGNGVDWRLEIRRGSATEPLAAGTTQGDQRATFGPFDAVPLEKGQVVALVIDPRDGNHFCDLTAVDLTLDDGTTTWDLAKQVSPNPLAGNPLGPWHFLSQPVDSNAASELPAPGVAWRRDPSAENARRVREHLTQDFPLTHPLLAPSLRRFLADTAAEQRRATAPATLAVTVPAAFAAGAEFVVTARLASPGVGSVQTQVVAERPTEPLTALLPGVPILVGTEGEHRRRIEHAFAEFRELFPLATCYTRIVPVDEVVTLRLYYREDEHLRRLLLDEAETRELDRLWDELLFVSEAPLKQVDAYEQIYQFATQDRPDLVNEFAPLRDPILAAAAAFEERQRAVAPAQRRAVVELATPAWRRPLTDVEVAELMQYPPRLMLARVLTSPHFLYRSEKVPAQTGPVDDWELATRLSYFLWSSLPDEELRSLADAGELRDPDVLAAQARRMLRDDKVHRLALEFGCQWLHVRDVATLDEKSERHFPTFARLRGDMQEEVVRFFTDLFQQDREVLRLLDADYTFVNQRLAEHYGIPFAGDGNEWRRVDGLRDRGRGGILGFAATLAKHSGASRSSAILRGTWLSEVVLGDKLPKPPRNVPILPDEPPAGLTERQLIERHSSDPACAGCHKRIDPYGFALEGFDAIGRGRPADTATTLHDGTAIDGLGGLRAYLLTERRDDFVEQFGRKLLGYALGRSAQLSDQPLLESMVALENPRVGDLVEWIVRSPQFRERRGSSARRDR